MQMIVPPRGLYCGAGSSRRPFHCGHGFGQYLRKLTLSMVVAILELCLAGCCEGDWNGFDIMNEPDQRHQTLHQSPCDGSTRQLRDLRPEGAFRAIVAGSCGDWVSLSSFENVTVTRCHRRSQLTTKPTPAVPSRQNLSTKSVDYRFQQALRAGVLQT